MAEIIPVEFGVYTPDLPPLRNPGLSVAKNMLPIRGGYEPLLTLADISADFSVLSERPRGAIAGITPEGNPYNFAGTATKLYAHRDDTQDVTRSSAVAYNCTGQSFWEFAIYGSAGRYHVIAVDHSDETQYFTLGASQKFERLGNPDLTNTVAPRAKHIGVIGSFVVLGNTYDTTNGQDDTAIHWSALNDPFNWPTPGTEVAVAVQSDRQPLGGDGGAVQRVVSGSEVGAVFQERKVWRVDYQGGDAIFQLSPVEPDRGVLVPAIAVPFGRNVFYLSEDGFYVFDYTSSQPIGDNIVDKTFLADLDSAYFDRVSAVSNPDKKQIWISYPGTGNSSGVPNKLLVYDWSLNQFSHADLDASWLNLAVHQHRSLDSPGTAADPNTDGVDGAGLGSFDERIAAPGALQIGAYSTSFALQGFTGAARTATLETGRRQLVPGSRSLVTEAQVIVDNADPTVQVRGISRANATANYGEPSKVNDIGFAPLRSDARYHTFRVNLPVGWDNAVGMEVMASRTGKR